MVIIEFAVNPYQTFKSGYIELDIGSHVMRNRKISVNLSDNGFQADLTG